MRTKTGNIKYIFVLICAFLVTNITGTTYYVATDGDNGNPGTSLVQPWKTLRYAESQLSDGDVVYVRGGIYHEYLIINVPNVIFQNYQNELPVIDGAEYDNEGNEVRWALPVDPDINRCYDALIGVNAPNVIIDGFEVRKSTGTGIKVWGSGNDNVIIRNCKAHDTYYGALQLSHGVKNTLIEDCDFYSGAAVLQFCNWSPPTCRNMDWGDPATVTTPNTENSIFRRCKIHDSHNEGINLERNSNGTTIEYCEIYGNRKVQIYPVSSSNHTIRYNLIYGTETNRIGKTGTGPGIYINHESNFVEDIGPAVGNNEVYGNLIANTDRNIWIAGDVGREIINTKIFNNILVEAKEYGIVSGSGTGGGHIFKNNIIWQTNGQIANIPGGKVDCDYNLWSRVPDNDAQGPNDPTYALPKLAKTTNWNNLTGGELNGSEFVLQSGSPAIDAGANLGSPYNQGLSPASIWPNDVSTLDQNNYGSGWEIGGMVYESNWTSIAEHNVHGSGTTLTEKKSSGNEINARLSVSPNPFNTSSVISYSISENSCPVSLKIHGIIGELVKDLYSGTSNFGNHSIVWDGRDNNNVSIVGGIYIVRLMVGGEVHTVKAVKTE